MIAFQGAEGIEFWNPYDVSSIRPEFRNWWRGVRKDGRVAHRPTPPPDGPWVAHADGFVNSRWLSLEGKDWKDSAHFLWPGGPLMDSPREPEAQAIPGLGLLSQQVYALTKMPKKQAVVWHTDQGEIIWPDRQVEEVASLMPDLFEFRLRVYLNRRRLGLIRSNKGFKRIFVLDNGQEYELSSTTLGAAEQLGLTNYVNLEPAMPQRFFDNQLRDWPLDLTKASRDFLRQNFPTPRQLIAAIVWQRFRDRQSGVFKRWGDTYRGFWYGALVHPLHRAGFLEEEDVESEVSLEVTRGKLSRSNYLFHLSHRVVGYLVDDCRFFSFREFGFKEPDPELFQVGKRRPEVLLITEKDDCLEYARKLVKEFGVSHYHLGSQPSLLRSEYAAERLLRVVQEIRVMAYVDYDVGGWILGRAAADQLVDQGLKVTAFDYLLRESCFTEEEKRLHSHPCKAGNAAHKTKARQWVEAGGGLDGQPRGIYASYVEPYARVRKLFTPFLA